MKHSERRIEPDDGVQCVWISQLNGFLDLPADNLDKFSSWQGQRYFGQGVDGARWPNEGKPLDSHHWIGWNLRSHLSQVRETSSLRPVPVPVRVGSPWSDQGWFSPNLYLYIYYSDTQKDRTDSIYQYLVGLDFSIFSVIAISQFNCTYQPYNLGYSTRVQTALEHTYWVSRNFRNHPGI